MNNCLNIYSLILKENTSMQYYNDMINILIKLQQAINPVSFISYDTSN